MVIKLSESTHESKLVNCMSICATHMDILHSAEHCNSSINGTTLLVRANATESLETLQCCAQKELLILGVVVAFIWDFRGQEYVMKQIGHIVLRLVDF